ncbi:MAG: autotransporter-associated beta strand repeat-containing protein, partial [Thermoguttaceae bacterium]
ANGGGFSAAGGAMAVDIGGDKRTLTWGAAGAGIAGTLMFGSTTASGVTDFQNGLNLGGAIRTIQVDDNPSSAGDRAVISGAISGTGGINKTGPGRLDLTGANTYSALGTTVSGGLLNVPNAAALGSGYGAKPVNIASGATLQIGGSIGFTSSTGVLTNNGTLLTAAGASLTVSGGAMAQGSGVFDCPVNVTNGGVFAPGGVDAIGSCSTQSALWGGGKYLLDIGDALGAAGKSWDLWTVSGTLSAPSSSVFTIAPTSLVSDGLLGPIADFDDQSSYSWLIATAGSVSDFSASQFAIDTSGFANPIGGGSFSVSTVGNNVYLNFQPASVPEPGTLVLLAAGVAAACGIYRRRNVYDTTR